MSSSFDRWYAGYDWSLPNSAQLKTLTDAYDAGFTDGQASVREKPEPDYLHRPIGSWWIEITGGERSNVVWERVSEGEGRQSVLCFDPDTLGHLVTSIVINHNKAINRATA